MQNKFVRRVTAIALLTFCSAFCPLMGQSAQAHTPTVLVIHSYNGEYHWTSDINGGIGAELSRWGTPYLLCTEYLDWKRFPDQTNVDNLRETFRHKYKNLKIDVLIVSDDKALQFAASNRKELFGDAPIVFTGIYPESVTRLTGGQGNVTGVYEEQDIRTNLEYALKIQDDARALYIVSDVNESGSAVERHIKDTMIVIAPQIPVLSLSNKPIEEIEATVAKLTQRDIVIIGSYSIDVKGRTFTGETLIGRVAMASKTPVYVLNTHHLGTGAFGGYLLSPWRCGENAGTLARKILAGISADSLPPMSNQSYALMFDWNAVQRYGINPARLPKEAQFLNRETPFLEKYRRETIVVGSVFAALLAMLYILSINLRRAKRLAAELSESNREIKQLNENLSRSDEELREQYLQTMAIKEDLERSEERYRLSSIGSNDAIWDWNAINDRVQFSDRWYEMTGYPRAAQQDMPIADLIHPQDKAAYKAALAAHERGTTEILQCEMRVRTASGGWKWILLRGKAVRDARGKPTRYAGSITDIDDRRHKEEEIESLAFYDQLTSLPNRTKAIEMTKQAIQAGDGEASCALIFVDIDNFKVVNDNFGHTTGDLILIRTAELLSSLANEKLSIARFGGDEFIAIVVNTDAAEVERFARMIISLLSRKIEVKGHNHFLSVSIGAALYPDNAGYPEELFQKADAALHRAKSSGKTKYCFYDLSIQAELLRRMELENGLRMAIENNELSVAYQPQVDLASGRIIALEALARWNHPSLGNVAPGDFIPIAEDSGQIDKIGTFVLRAAARFLKRAEKAGHRQISVAVNVSVKQLQENGFTEEVLAIARDERVDPSKITLEITESFIIDNLVLIVSRLTNLKEAGFRLALDDFGKGYSSLAYLRSLPVHYIKIDKSFIDDISSTDGDRPLVKTIIALAHQLGMKVVAEGVENAEQLGYLRTNGCDVIQGYYYSQPNPEDIVLGQLELSFK